MKVPILYQRIEATAGALTCLYFYAHLHYNWLWFIALWLSIDLFMIGYAKSNKLGAHTYNIGHSLAAPLVLLVAGTVSSTSWLIASSIIWLSHIAIDRMLGYGLKNDTGFTDTHLGRIGKK